MATSARPISTHPEHPGGMHSASPALVMLGRAGYAAKGVVYVVIGALAARAATHISPYIPFRVWDSDASRKASRAADLGAPGCTHPKRSPRIWAPIHCRNGLCSVAVRGGSSPSSRLR